MIISTILKFLVKKALVAFFGCGEVCPAMGRLLDSVEVFAAGLPCSLPAPEHCAL